MVTPAGFMVIQCAVRHVPAGWSCLLCFGRISGAVNWWGENFRMRLVPWNEARVQNPYKRWQVIPHKHGECHQSMGLHFTYCWFFSSFWLIELGRKGAFWWCRDKQVEWLTSMCSCCWLLVNIDNSWWTLFKQATTHDPLSKRSFIPSKRPTSCWWYRSGHIHIHFYEARGLMFRFEYFADVSSEFKWHSLICNAYICGLLLAVLGIFVRSKRFWGYG